MALKNFTIKDFCSSFGIKEKELSLSVKKLIGNLDFSYKEINNQKLENLILKILKIIDIDKQIIGHKKRKNVWEKGWKENLNEFRDSNYDESKLIPKFIRFGNPIRLNQKYVIPSNPEFELNFVTVCRQWVLEYYFNNIKNIYEFGCGTGFNLLAASKLFPNKSLFGSDFVQSSVDLINEISHSKDINLKGDFFDLINPNYEYKIKKNSGIFTFGALEQLAGKIDEILEYLIVQKPKICVHIEPIIELYDENNLIDYLAIKFQSKRGYTDGLLSKLYNLKNNKKIEILKVKRLFFGSLLMEGYNLVAWRPL